MEKATQGRKRKERGGKRKGGLFIDKMFGLYVREVALDKWREVVDLEETNGLSARAAVDDAGVFLERGPYAGMWREVWRRHFGAPGDSGAGGSEAEPVTTTAPEAVFPRIEAAVLEALKAEVAERKARGDGDLEDTTHYKGFVDRLMENLLEDAHGEIEDMDAYDEMAGEEV